ncbi:MAG: hypothetical protein R3F59_10220 [Myxococcota bacterium]
MAFRDGRHPRRTASARAPQRRANYAEGDAEATRCASATGSRSLAGPDVPPPPAMPGQPALPPVPRTIERQWARVGDGPVVEVDGALGSAVQDLIREHGRKVERDDDKGLDEATVDGAAVDGAVPAR